MATIQQFIQERDAINKTAAAWANTTKQHLLFELSRLDIRQTGELMAAVKKKPKLKKKQGLVERISFGNTKGGIMTAMGVGKGVTRAEQLAGASGRVAKDWYSTRLSKEVVKLANDIMEQKADALMSEVATTIKVKS